MIISIFQQSRINQLIFLLLIKSLLICSLIFFAGIELGPDEAQYWTWSQSLDWGYYSKPPGIAWQIWLGTKIFGQTEWGVRFLSIVLSFFQSYLIYRLALKASLLPRTAFWCAILMAFCPFGIVGSFLAITDCGFLLCWTGACLTVVQALDLRRQPNPLVVGLWILCGALFKWPIYIFWLFFLMTRFWYFRESSKKLLLAGIMLSLIGLLPSIWWNGSHDWATFRHVFATVQGRNDPLFQSNFLFDYIGSQFLLLSPILFILFIGSLWGWFKERKNLSPALFFCGFVSLATLSLFSIASYFQKIQGNWSLFAYPTGIIILGWNIFQCKPESSRYSSWGKWGLILSILMTFSLFAFPSLYKESSFLSYYAPPYRMNPFKHNQGFKVLSKALVKHGYDPRQNFLFSDKYQTTSQLSFYGPGQFRAYFLNLNGIRKNQFSYWPSLQEERQKQVGYFVWTEHAPPLNMERKEEVENKKIDYQMKLELYFEKVEFLETIPLIYKGPEVVRAAFIYRCDSCKKIPLTNYEIY